MRNVGSDSVYVNISAKINCAVFHAKTETGSAKQNDIQTQLNGFAIHKFVQCRAYRVFESAKAADFNVKTAICKRNNQYYVTILVMGEQAFGYGNDIKKKFTKKLYCYVV